MLLAHGDTDRLVPAAQSERPAAALRAAGAPVELEVVLGAGHLWAGAADVAGIVDRSVAFLRSPAASRPLPA